MAPAAGLKGRQLITFCMVWVIYGSSYLLRKPLGVVKSDLQTTYHLSKTDLGWLDSCFFFPYAFMQMMLGNLGDRYGARATLTISLLLLGLSMFSFGWWSNTWVFAVLLFFNGSSQANLWPNCAKMLSSWYEDDRRSTIFGMFGTCVFVGGIGATALTVELQRRYSPDMKLIFLVPSMIVVIIGIICHFVLRSPEEMNIIVPGIAPPKHVSSSTEPKSLNLFHVWRMRMVPELAWTMFGMKLVRYCLYMWLPMYLSQNLHYSNARAGMLSTSYEIGGVLGTAVIGLFINKVAGGRPRWGVFYALVGGATSLMLFQYFSDSGLYFNFTFLFLAGAFSSGPDSIVSGSLAIEVGERENAQSAVSGIVNGFGSIGTVIQGPLIAFIATQFGWSGTFYIMIILTFGSAAAILKAAIMHDRGQAASPDKI